MYAARQAPPVSKAYRAKLHAHLTAKREREELSGMIVDLLMPHFGKTLDELPADVRTKVDELTARKNAIIIPTL